MSNFSFGARRHTLVTLLLSVTVIVPMLFVLVAQHNPSTGADGSGAQAKFTPLAANGASTHPKHYPPKVGAEVLRPDALGDPAGAPKDHFAAIRPSPLTASVLDRPPGGCSTPHAAARDTACVFGVRNSPVQVDLVGDSHAMQWQPGFAAAARPNHWRLVTHIKPGCPYTTATVTYHRRGPFTACSTWNKNVTQSLLEEKPDLVVTTDLGFYKSMRDGTVLTGAANTREMVSGYLAAWHVLTSAGINVVALAETPHPLISIPNCVRLNLRHLSRCAGPRAEMIRTHTPLKIAARQAPGVTYVDLNDLLCPTDMCAAVIGGVMVYRDHDHLGATYVATTGTHIAVRFAPLVNG